MPTSVRARTSTRRFTGVLRASTRHTYVSVDKPGQAQFVQPGNRFSVAAELMDADACSERGRPRHGRKRAEVQIPTQSTAVAVADSRDARAGQERQLVGDRYREYHSGAHAEDGRSVGDQPWHRTDGEIKPEMAAFDVRHADADDRELQRQRLAAITW